MSEEPRAGTTASLDRRVERLEVAQSEMANALDRVEREQKHSREIAELRFKGLETSIGGLDRKLDTISAAFQAALVDSAKMIGDPALTPAGRQLMDDIADLATGRDDNKRAIKALEISVARATGAVALGGAIVTVLVALMTLFAPTIRQALGLSPF